MDAVTRVLTSVVLAAEFAVPAMAAEQTGQDYVVQKGDTLGKIATRFYEDALAYPTIIEGNNAKAKSDDTYEVIHTPDEIHPGEKLWIPTLVAAEADDMEGHGEHEMVHWGYQGEGGPTHWGSLEEQFAACGTGMTQSPVSVPSDAPNTSAELDFGYQSTKLNVVNNGHTVQVNYDPGSARTIDGKAHKVAQFHFHSPSENTVDGVAAALEMHIVHVAEDGSLAVVAVFFDIGEEDNPFLAKFWGVLPPAGHEVGLKADANVASAFDADGGITSFSGSLTTPPCSEGVKWLVVKTRESLSKDQLAAFVGLIGLNARPTQPLNGRSFGTL